MARRVRLAGVSGVAASLRAQYRLTRTANEDQQHARARTGDGRGNSRDVDDRSAR